MLFLTPDATGNKTALATEEEKRRSLPLKVDIKPSRHYLKVMETDQVLNHRKMSSTL